MTHQDLIIEEPRRFYSNLDEKHFFDWLQEIPAVKSVVGGVNGLTVKLDTPIKDPDLRDLIAVLTRYGVNRKCLAVLLNASNQAWFADPQKYWHSAVFE
jgi:hypothetical protein